MIEFTPASKKVLKYLLGELPRSQSGAQISISTKIGSGVLYPTLARLEAVGWLTSEWEADTPKPRRRLYKLTGTGDKYAREQL